VVPRKKKKKNPGHALPMFNDPVSSPVLPNYFARQSTNLVGQALKPLEIVNQSKWLTLYPDPWDPAKFVPCQESIRDQLLLCVPVRYVSRWETVSLGRRKQHTMNTFYVANVTVVIFDRAIYTRETGKEEGWKFKNRRFGLGRVVRSPF
jgi:hypothetical protein